MKFGIRGKAEGTLHAVKGKVDELFGKSTDNPELGAKSEAQKIDGSGKEPSEKWMIAMRYSEEGKIGWILLWLLGIPIPILLVLYFLRGCT